MRIRIVLIALILASILGITAGIVLADTPTPAAFSAGAVVPASWVGVWNVYEATYSPSCVGPVVSTRTYTDTLCLGEVFNPLNMTDHYDFSCGGPGFTDTTFKFGCTDFVSAGSDREYRYEVSWQLDGDVAQTLFTETTEFAAHTPPPVCDAMTMGTRTRISPAACGVVSTRRRSWGTLKLLYR